MNLLGDTRRLEILVEDFKNALKYVVFTDHGPSSFEFRQAPPKDWRKININATFKDKKAALSMVR